MAGVRGYEYGYNLPPTHSAEIQLAGASGNGYRITVYGPATDPVIYLNNQPVRVYTSLDEGDRLIIESNGGIKEIWKVKANGWRINEFNNRDKVYSPFLELGDDTTLSYGDIKFDFTTIERRSEPTWS